MRKKLKLKPCIKVPFANKLYEGYEIVLKGRGIVANVSVDKVKDMMTDFIGMHDGPLFFFLELLATRLPEGLTEGFIDEDKMKKDVYYLDGLDQENALNILREAGDVLCNDGLSAFGFGLLEGEDEIMFDNYNLVRFLGKNLKQYETLLKKYGIEKVDDLFTVGEAFDREHPGDFTRYEEGEFTAFDIPKALEKYGMYLAEQREW